MYRFTKRLFLRSSVPGSACVVLVVALAATGCNPNVFDDVLDGAHVRKFVNKSTLNSPMHSSIAVPYDTTGDGLHDHLLVANGKDASVGWMELNEAGFARNDVPDGDVLLNLFFPIERADEAIVGGLAEVPDPTLAMDPDAPPDPYGLVAFQSPTDLERARVVRFRLPGFQRADDVNIDIINPRVEGSLLPKFGNGLAAINLDADQSDPDYEVMVGSELGVAVFDNLGKNRIMYEQAAAGGDGSPAWYGWTYCDNLIAANGIAAGLVGPASAPTFVVGTRDGLTFVAEQEPPVTNMAGAPVYDCAKRVIPPPPEATETFGTGLLVADLNGDGLDDLAVGDPDANRVFIYYLTATGLNPTPTVTLEPFEDEDGEAVAFGAALGKAQLGPQIGDVLLVGAPDSAVGQTQGVGRFYVFSLPTLEEIRPIIDTEPSKNSHWGQWVGGISVGEREEIVIHGATQGRVHLAINEDDPRP